MRGGWLSEGGGGRSERGNGDWARGGVGEGGVRGMIVAHDSGRPVATLQFPYQATDRTFVAQRLDGECLSNGRYMHCTFVNLSFKETTLTTFEFLNCVFIDCYFRRATLKNCSIVGCKFIDCELPKLALITCDFRYTRFRRCQVAFESMRHTLPVEPNLRRDTCRDLASQSSKLGLGADARRYRMEELSAREQHLRNAVLGESEWYTSHYRGFARLRALLRLTGSYTNKYLFGYGESLSILLRNSFLAALGVFPFIYYLVPSGFDYQNGAEHSYGECVLLSISTMFPIPDLSSISTGRWYTHVIASVEAACGVMVFAFIAAYVFRWSVRQ